MTYDGYCVNYMYSSLAIGVDGSGVSTLNY